MSSHAGLGYRKWLALSVLVASWFILPTLEEAARKPVAHMLKLQPLDGDSLVVGPFGWEMVVRFICDAALLGLILALLQRSLSSFPLRDGRWLPHLSIGLATGLIVMVAAILSIVASNSAKVSLSAQPIWMAVLNGFGWMAVDLVGAAGEELFFRGSALLVAAAFLGWRGAIIVSGLLFFVIHIGNPGSNPIWLSRLFLQGSLLAYAVFRTGSLWWSVGYHTGWNWASAPLFGAAGSGYLNAGHILDFIPGGANLLTGGAVGPEGSIFAFAAILLALVLLRLTTPRRAPVDVDLVWQ